MIKNNKLNLSIVMFIIMILAYIPAVRHLFQSGIHSLGISQLGDGSLHLDKLGHFGLFYLLTLLCLYGIQPKKQRFILLGLLFLGLADEILQQKFAYRSADIFDLSADYLGIFLGRISVKYRSLIKIKLKKQLPFLALYFHFVLLKIQSFIQQIGTHQP